LSDNDRDARKPGKTSREAPKKKTPTAVALHRERRDNRAPKVVASGKGSVAEQILEIAFANDVKVREDADLVELLSHVDIDTEIPLEAFAAVAEILAYVYRANGEMAPRPQEAPTPGP
jgi:flagellar biosynthesis protein